jgi:hypothetical protein
VASPQIATAILTMSTWWRTTIRVNAPSSPLAASRTRSAVNIVGSTVAASIPY